MTDELSTGDLFLLQELARLVEGALKDGANVSEDLSSRGGLLAGSLDDPKLRDTMQSGFGGIEILYLESVGRGPTRDSSHRARRALREVLRSIAEVLAERCTDR